MGKATKILPLIIILLIWFIFSYLFFLKGLIPAPLDFLKNFYNPWQAYQTFPIKNSAIPDVVSQIIPWKIYTIQSFKQGIIPLWNPYNFAGTPHLANFQSASFQPFNFLFFLLPFAEAWSLYILLQPLLAAFFTYFYCRKIKLGKPSSFIVAICFAFCGFLTVWLEYGTLGWAIVWLPLSLYLLEMFWEKQKTIFLFFFNLVVTFSLLSGHLQISLYLILAVVCYLIYNFWQRRINKKIFWLNLFSLIFPFLLATFQLWPTLELYFNSPRSQQISGNWYKGLQIPFVQLITFFFPDFFGNPVTRNQWGGGSYVEMMGYIGFLPMLLAIFYLINLKKENLFFIILLIISLLLALPTPLSDLVLYLKIPILSSSAPSRIICLISFSLAILAGYGFEFFLTQIKENKKKIERLLLLVLGILFILLPISYLINKISFKNIIFPSGIYLLFLAMTFLVIKYKKEKKLLFTIYYLLFILLIVFDLFRFWHKFNPFTKKEDLFSSLSLIDYLKQNQDQARVFGILDDNLNLPFGIYTTTGYDSLTIIDYQQLLGASEAGNENLPARTTGENIAKRSRFAKNLLDLLGVKYVVVGKSDLFAFPTWEHPTSFQLAWEDKNYFIYKNNKAWPRYFLTADYEVVPEDKFLIKTLENQENKIILIEEPNLFREQNQQKEVSLARYESNEAVFKIKTETENLFFLSDTYYPGWQALIDSKPAKIYRANYAFRAVKIPRGEHLVEFIYQPQSFYQGVKISLLAFFTMIISLTIFTKLILIDKRK